MQQVSWAYRPGCSCPAPTLFPVYSVYSAPHMTSTMTGKTPFHCPELSRRKMFPSDSWRLKDIKWHHPERLQVARQTFLMISSPPQHVEPPQHCEFNADQDSVEDLDKFPYLKHVDNIPDYQSQSRPPPLPWMEIYTEASTPLIDFIAEACECDTQACRETNLHNNPCYPSATHEEYKYIQCVIKKKGMKLYKGNILKGEHAALRFRSFKNSDSIQKPVAAMSVDHALWEWELHTLGDMRWNDNHRRPMQYWSLENIKSMRWLMWQPAYIEHFIYTAQCCFISHKPQMCLYAEMHTTDWWQ